MDTFRQAVRFMDRRSNFHFAQSQAALYALVERRDPALFAAMRKYIRRGQWHPVGGTWVECDMNLPGGEALARQFLLGQTYFRDKLGRQARTGWAVDNFGQSWTLPQILRQSRIDRFSLMRGGKGTVSFRWTGADGTSLPAVDLGAAVNRGREAFRAALNPLTARIPGAIASAANKAGLHSIVFPFGVGDHGGGPTLQMIQGIEALGKTPGMQLTFTGPDDAFARFLNANPPREELRDELNYESYKPGQSNPFVFPGCYSSQAQMKVRNYRCENLLAAAEVFSALASLTTGHTYPAAPLREAWQGVLFNQCHDLLPGSSVHRVYEDAHHLYDHVEAQTADALDRALAALAATARPSGPGYPLVVFNAQDHARTEAAQTILDFEKVPDRIDLRSASGERLPGQILEQTRVYDVFQRVRIVFIARHVPPMGFTTYTVRAYDSAGREMRVLGSLQEPVLAAWHPEIRDRHTPWSSPAQARKEAAVLENGAAVIETPRFRLEVDPATGGIRRLLERPANREWAVPTRQLARLRLLGDDNQGYTAWKIRWTGEEIPVVPAGPPKLLSSGPVLQQIQVPLAAGSSRFDVEYTLYSELPRVDIQIHADWRERLKTLKMAFPLPLTTAAHTRSVPFGAIRRANDGIEEPAQRWIDLSDADHGLSVLNRSTPGCDISGDTVRMTLLRSPTDPDTTADIGEHHLLLSLYPHAGDWSVSETPRQAQSLGSPLIVRTPKPSSRGVPESSLLSVSEQGLQVSAFKRAEDGSGYVVRLVETQGRTVQKARIRFTFPPVSALETNLLEEPVGPARLSAGQLETAFRPFQIRTFRVRFDRNSRPPSPIRSLRSRATPTGHAQREEEARQIRTTARFRRG